MIARGRFDRRVQFRLLASVRNGMGIEQESWTDGPSAWALVTFGTGQERRAAGASEAAQPATFRVRSCAALRAVTRRDRIAFDGDEWGITSIAPVGAQGGEIEFTAVRRG